MGLLLTILLSLLIVRFISGEQSRKEERVSLNMRILGSNKLAVALPIYLY